MAASWRNTQNGNEAMRGWHSQVPWSAGQTILDASTQEAGNPAPDLKLAALLAGFGQAAQTDCQSAITHGDLEGYAHPCAAMGNPQRIFTPPGVGQRQGHLVVCLTIHSNLLDPNLRFPAFAGYMQPSYNLHFHITALLHLVFNQITLKKRFSLRD